MDLQVNLALVVAVWMAGSVVLVLALAFAARWGVKPVLDSIARLREIRVAELEQRFTRLERRVDRMSIVEGVRVGHSS